MRLRRREQKQHRHPPDYKRHRGPLLSVCIHHNHSGKCTRHSNVALMVAKYGVMFESTTFFFLKKQHEFQGDHRCHYSYVSKVSFWLLGQYSVGLAGLDTYIIKELLEGTLETRGRDFLTSSVLGGFPLCMLPREDLIFLLISSRV